MTTGGCLSCPSVCQTCNSSASCVRCPPGLYLRLAGGVICYETCLDGTYPDNSTFMCQPCPLNCKTCSSPSNCTACNFYDPLFYYLYKGACLLSCPNGTYMDFLTWNVRGCLPCDPACSNCYGASKDQCLTCLKGSLMDMTSCLPNCTIGKYPDNTSHCDSCHQLCATCFGPTDFQCLSCNYGFYLYRHRCY
jgi:proprotein convertase subtilisin/kexin type 5